ncbi:prolyl 3-hydroxylase OGFOD1 isoform X2 [Hemicordylus capensis]|uniref:prolyl 3-hydroxylase OGFOD1 isoform X2 n=1 Tax=Hemicordylus capensis TaxID=884348 RepID=UPI002304950F|nr:prolyl 3-hydroxylase OGFOD1 isoform X2 [Hemicordylus capensis]
MIGQLGLRPALRQWPGARHDGSRSFLARPRAHEEDTMSGRRVEDLGAVAGAKKRAKREVGAELSAALREPTLREKVAAAWARKEALEHEAIVLDPVPFHHCIIPNFIQNEGFLEGLQKELLNLHFHEKCNDLYKFKQSDDLKKREEPHIAALRKVLFEEFRGWLSDVAQVQLEATIDLSCAKYEYTDQFQPRLITKSLVPSWNSLAFFEVSPVSFHQVAEVVSKGKCRLSVSGWFHGSSLARPPRPIEPCLPRSPHIPRDHEILYDWINPAYLEMDSQAQIQEEFEDQSEILLKDFLKDDKFHLVCEALKKEGPSWSRRGPPNKRLYEKAEEESLPPVLKECMELFRSEAFFLLLSNFTGLKLHFLAPEEEGEETAVGDSLSKHSQGESSREETSRRGHTDESGETSDNEEGERKSGSSPPLCAGELRRWTKGCYTLVHDAEMAEFALDLLLFCGCEEWDVERGGFTSYIAKGEDEELLTVNPENNCLALVYRDRETLKFVKYINCRSSAQKATHPDRTAFWDFCFVYYE